MLQLAILPGVINSFGIAQPLRAQLITFNFRCGPTLDDFLWQRRQRTENQSAENFRRGQAMATQ